MSMNLHYVSSTGQAFDLKVGHLRTRTADFHNYTWLPRGITQQYGEKVYRFDREPVTYSALISVFGSLKERREYLNLLHAAFENDIRTLTPGQIQHGLDSIDCFITFSSTYYEDPFTQNEILIYCPYPFWTRSTTHRMTIPEEFEYSYLDFPYDFQYDYKGTLAGYEVIDNSAVAPAEWIMTIKGPAASPMVYIDDMVIGVYATIGTDEEIVINSKDKTVVKIGNNGMETNLFNSRYKASSIFQQLTSGSHSVMWSGYFEFVLDVFEERSEPLWI